MALTHQVFSPTRQQFSQKSSTSATKGNFLKFSSLPGGGFPVSLKSTPKARLLLASCSGTISEVLGHPQNHGHHVQRDLNLGLAWKPSSRCAPSRTLPGQESGCLQSCTSAFFRALYLLVVNPVTSSNSLCEVFPGVASASSGNLTDKTINSI